MSEPDPAERRATALLRLYPRTWRARYGEEFLELLIADIGERPRSWRRALDVCRGALVARLGRLGFAGFVLEPDEQVRASLAVLGCCLALFLGFGAAMWSQLTIGWQWSEPDTGATTLATVVISAAMLALVVLALVAAAPVLWGLAARVVRSCDQRLAGPAALLVAGAATVFLGGRHFANAWPGTGGHHWPHQDLVPAGLAAFTWASTLSVSSYWAHPAALAAFPVGEVVWMALSPLALACLVIGAAGSLRRLDLSARVLRLEIRLAGAACCSMAVFLGGCCVWIVDGGSGPRDLFHVGAIDVMGAAVMALALVVGRRALSGARRGSLALAAS